MDAEDRELPSHHEEPVHFVRTNNSSQLAPPTPFYGEPASMTGLPAPSIGAETFVAATPAQSSQSSQGAMSTFGTRLVVREGEQLAMAPCGREVSEIGKRNHRLAGEVFRYVPMKGDLISLTERTSPISSSLAQVSPEPSPISSPLPTNAALHGRRSPRWESSSAPLTSS